MSHCPPPAKKSLLPSCLARAPSEEELRPGQRPGSPGRQGNTWTYRLAHFTNTSWLKLYQAGSRWKAGWRRWFWRSVLQKATKELLYGTHKVVNEATTKIIEKKEKKCLKFVHRYPGMSEPTPLGYPPGHPVQPLGLPQSGQPGYPAYPQPRWLSTGTPHTVLTPQTNLHHSDTL